MLILYTAYSHSAGRHASQAPTTWIRRPVLRRSRYRESYIRDHRCNTLAANICNAWRYLTHLFQEFYRIKRDIQRIHAAEGTGASEQDKLLARNIQTSLATKVQEVSSSFRKKQSSYLQSKCTWQQIENYTWVIFICLP